MNKEKIKKIAYFVLAGLVSPLIFEGRGLRTFYWTKWQFPFYV